MADYTGIMVISEEDLVAASLPIAEAIIRQEDAEDFIDSYEPSEGCP
jgi:hypothetical protein